MAPKQRSHLARKLVRAVGQHGGNQVELFLLDKRQRRGPVAWRRLWEESPNHDLEALHHHLARLCPGVLMTQ